MPIVPAEIQFDEQGNAHNAAYNDIYFNPGHAAGKARHLFHRATRFDDQVRALGPDQPLVIGELGFGLALNFLATWAAFEETATPGCRLHYVGFDVAPPSRDQLRRAWGDAPTQPDHAQQLLAGWPGRVAGVHRVELTGCSLTLHLGEIQATLAQSDFRGGADAWFLDGFAPEKNPAMWSEPVFREVHARTRPGGRLGSFTAAGHVRRALEAAGFAVERMDGEPLKRHIVSAQRPGPDAPPRRRRPQRVAVVGAGWAGLSVAEALHRRGHRVTVLDAARPGAGASGNRQAVVSPVLDAAASPRQDFYRSAFVLASRRHERVGVLRRPDPRKDRALLEQAARTFEALDGWFEWRSDTPSGDGLWMPTAGVARFSDFVERVCGCLPEASGRWPWTATGLERSGDAWVLHNDLNASLETDAVVLACAAAVRGFAQTGDWPLRRIRGQVTHARATPQSQPIDHAVVGEAYLCPAHDGVHSVGATFSHDDTETRLRQTDHDDNRRRAAATAPGWAASMDWSAPAGRVGLRVSTPDYLPMIGPVPGAQAAMLSGEKLSLPELPTHPNLYAATGFGAHGVITAALAAALLADLIDQTPVPCSAQAHDAIHPGRFLVRAAKRRQPIAFPPVN